MNIEAVIEIPKGNDRRWHLNYAGTAIEDFGPIKEKIPINEGIMPVAYGYLEYTQNEIEKDHVDVLVFSTRQFSIGERVAVMPFAYIERDDGDHKVIAIDTTMNFSAWEEVPLEERELILSYFGYNHKILAIHGLKETVMYIQKTSV